MKKKIFKIFSICIISYIGIIGLIACDTEEKFEHKHNFTSVVIAPTCTESGYTTHMCSCGESYNDTYVSALDHEFTNYISDNNATQEADGTKTAICNRIGCDETDTIIDVGSKLPTQEHTHSYTDSISAPTCTEQGYTTHTCSCGASYIDTYISALDHEFTNYVSDNNATQEADGTKTAICNRNGCDETDTITDVGSKLPSGYSEGLTFITYRSGYAVSSIGTCTDTTIIIPSEYNDLPVIAIAKDCFNAKSNIQAVIIPDSVLIIEDYAISYCKNLSRVDLGNGVKEIGMSFAGCDALTSIRIPASVEVIDNLAFYLSENLESIVVDDNNSVYSSQDGILYNKAKTEVICCPANNNTKNLTLPSSLLTIGSYSFVNCGNIETITMSNNVTTIAASAFKDCHKLESIVISNSITKIENWAFENCTALKSCIVPNGVTMLYSYVFQDCTSLEWIYVSKNIERMGYNPFDGCNGLKTIYFGGTSIEWSSITYVDTAPSYIGINIIFEYDMACNHEIVIDEAREATCTLVGLTKGSHCKICGTIFETQQEIPLADHTEEIILEVFPTCSTVGYSQGVKCSACKTTIITPVELPKSAHMEEDIPSIAATCYSFGYSGGKQCSVCKEVICEPKRVEMISHITTDLAAVAPTCSSSGKTAGKQCIVCQAVVEGYEYVAPLPHTYNDGVCTECNTIYYSNGFTYQKYANWTNVQYGVSVQYAAIITGYTGTDTEVYIPRFDDKYIVVSIDNDAFKNNTKITKVKIPNTVYSIGGSAFRGCTNLESVSIPETVKQIYGYAFEGCSKLKTINIPDSVTEIGTSAFQACTNLKNVTLSNKITKIESQLFYNCKNLESIVIPNLVTKIGFYAFGNCENLSSITFLGAIEEIDTQAFYYCKLLPKIVLNISVEEIGSRSFVGCDNLTIYCETASALSGWHEEWNYSNCPVVWNCNSPDAIPDSGTTATGYKWQLNEDRTITIVGYTGLDSIISIPSTINDLVVTTIGGEIFANNTIIEIVIIPNTVKSIGYGAFADCSALKSISLGTSVEDLGNYLFENCVSLKEITLPNSIKWISPWAFRNCSSLVKVNYTGTIDQWTTIHFSDCFANPLYYAKKLYINNVEVIDVNITTATEINDYAFYNCSNFKSIIISDSVTSIASSSFYGCNNLFQVENGITYIDKWVIDCDTSVVQVKLRTNTKGIVDSVFYECSHLTNITIPESIISIAGWSFWGCSNLTTMTIPNSVINIGYAAFHDCNNLMNIYYGGTYEQWKKINIDSSNTLLTNATIYYYSEATPTITGNYWYYVNGVPTIWEYFG